MEKLYDIMEIKHKLIDDLKHDIETCGIENIDVHVAGEQVDMIKDLAEAEEKCLKAHYYAEIIDAMEEAEERSGYDRYRHANGRFASKGTGHMTRGYTPTDYDMIMPEMMHIPYDNMRMGYPTNQTGRMHTYGYHDGSEHMKPKDSEHYVDEMTETVRDIWSGATYEQKKKIKSDISALLAEMAL